MHPARRFANWSGGSVAVLGTAGCATRRAAGKRGGPGAPAPCVVRNAVPSCYSAANTSPAISTAASSCIAGMACE